MKFAVPKSMRMIFLIRNRLATSVLLCLLAMGSGCTSSSNTSGSGASPSASSPDGSSSFLSPGLWEPVSGLEGGNIRSLLWTGMRLDVLGDNGIFAWNGDGPGFELLSGHDALEDVGLDMGSGPTAGLESIESFAYGSSTDTLFAIVGASVWQRVGEQWVQTAQTAFSLSEWNGVLYLRQPGNIETSTDGSDWSTLTSIPSETAPGGCCFSNLAFDDLHNKFYLYNNQGVFSYNVDPSTWHALDSGDDLNHGPQTMLQTIAVDPSNGDLYIGNVFDIYVSHDGTTWSAPLLYAQTGVWSVNVWSIAFDPANKTVYAATGRGIYSRIDGGAWTLLPVIGAVPNEIQFKDGALWAAAPNGLWSYTQAGGWRHHPSNGLNTKNIVALEFKNGVLSAQSDEKFVVLMPDNNDVPSIQLAVYHQASFGAWTLEKSAEPLSTFTTNTTYDTTQGKWIFTKISIASPSMTIEATADGVFVSQGAGPWQAWKDGLPTFRITSFAYDPAQNTLYAGTIGHGLYQLKLSAK